MELKSEALVFSKGKFDLFEHQLLTGSGIFDNCTMSDVFYMDSYTLIVPPGEPYTDVERMFLMFDIETWIAIAVTFAISLIVIQIFKFMPRKIQNFMFGREIRTPTLNLVSIFLNGGQFRVPGRNFARFNLMMFIIWSLIIRTCYQSMLYQLLQADSRKPPIKSLEELYEKNFTYCSHAEDLDEESDLLNETLTR